MQLPYSWAGSAVFKAAGQKFEQGFANYHKSCNSRVKWVTAGFYALVVNTKMRKGKRKYTHTNTELLSEAQVEKWRKCVYCCCCIYYCCSA